MVYELDEKSEVSVCWMLAMAIYCRILCYFIEVVSLRTEPLHSVPGPRDLGYRVYLVKDESDEYWELSQTTAHIKTHSTNDNRENKQSKP